ncbi:hypothetical protein ACKWRH_09030 [Bradyrhizobium sp. Pa8]|uniref:hypothetical protein n=1 Tax=Bradyrhizobium sp. Pa8 TaxID=3386552 RepID=UPI00403F7277
MAPHIRRWMRSRASRVATGSVAILIMSQIKSASPPENQVMALVIDFTARPRPLGFGAAAFARFAFGVWRWLA